MKEYKLFLPIEDRKAHFLVHVQMIVRHLTVWTTAALENARFCGEVDDIAEIIKGVETLKSEAEKLCDALEELSNRKGQA